VTRLWLLLAGINGFMAVALGAYGTHGLADVLTDQGQINFQLASQYQLFHAIAFVGVAWLSSRAPVFGNIAGGLFLLGVFFFGVSLYTGELSGSAFLASLAPYGGASFMLGWITVAAAGLLGRMQPA